MQRETYFIGIGTIIILISCILYFGIVSIGFYIPQSRNISIGILIIYVLNGLVNQIIFLKFLKFKEFKAALILNLIYLIFFGIWYSVVLLMLLNYIEYSETINSFFSLTGILISIIASITLIIETNKQEKLFVVFSWTYLICNVLDGLNQILQIKFGASYFHFFYILPPILMILVYKNELSKLKPEHIEVIDDTLE